MKVDWDDVERVQDGIGIGRSRGGGFLHEDRNDVEFLEL
jgi:hypothetical protein